MVETGTANLRLKPQFLEPYIKFDELINTGFGDLYCSVYMFLLILACPPPCANYPQQLNELHGPSFFCFGYTNLFVIYIF